MTLSFQTSSLRRAAQAALLVAVAVPLAATTAQAALAIAWGPTVNVTCSHHVCTASASDAVLGIKMLQNQLAKANVKVVSGSQAGDIDIEGGVTLVSSNTLTLDSYHSVRIDKAVSFAGSGGLTITTNDGGTGGMLSFGNKGNVTFWSTANALTINGHAYTLVNDIATLASDVAATPGGYYALANSYNAQPDGTYSHSPVTTALYGTFEGLGNTISNLTINDPTYGDYAGLFATVYYYGTIQNISMLNTNVSDTAGMDGSAGILVGNNHGAIRYAFATGTVSAINSGGGLAGINDGLIEFSYSSAAVASGNYAGGLIGENSGTILQSYATGRVQGGAEAGGLLGEDDELFAQISQCYASGAVSGDEVGGLVGVNANGTVTQTYETGSVTGSVEQGGLLGHSGGTVTFSYWDRTTTGMGGQSNGTGDHRHTIGTKPMTSYQLKSALPPGFDPAIWGQNAAINGGFPYLLAIPPS